MSRRENHIPGKKLTVMTSDFYPVFIDLYRYLSAGTTELITAE